MNNDDFRKMIIEEIEYYTILDYDFEYNIEIVGDNCAELVFSRDNFRISFDIFYCEEDKELMLTTLSESEETLDEIKLMEQFLFKCIDTIDCLTNRIKRLQK